MQNAAEKSRRCDYMGIEIVEITRPSLSGCAAHLHEVRQKRVVPRRRRYH